MLITDSELLVKAQRAMELGRVKLGLTAAAMAASVPLVAALVRFQGGVTVALGAFVTVTVGILVWRGGGLSRGAMSGLKAGLIPLTLSLAANAYGHVCVPGHGCSSLCIPACALGGVAAGLAVEMWARSAVSPWRVRAAGAFVSLAVGALGCACVGSAGIVGLVLGYSVSVTVGLVGARVVANR